MIARDLRAKKAVLLVHATVDGLAVGANLCDGKLDGHVAVTAKPTGAVFADGECGMYATDGAYCAEVHKEVTCKACKEKL